MNEKTLIRDLTTGSVTKQLLIFSYPFILSNLLQTLYIMVDMAVVGQFVGSAGLSAVSIGGDLTNFFTFIAMGFASAGQVIVAQYVGSGNREELNSTIGTMFSLILGVSLLFTVGCTLSKDWLLGLMNTSEEAYDMARDFSSVCYLGFFFIFGYNTVSAILRGMGDSARPLLFIGIASVTNILLELLFVAVLDLSAWGAALATVLSQGLSFVISIIYLYRRRAEFCFDFRLRSLIPRGLKVRQLCRLGLPMAVQYAAISFSMLLVNSSINAYGVAASAATGVGNKLGNIASVVASAFSTADSAMVGQNIAARKTERVTKIVAVSLAIGLAFSAVLSLLLALFPRGIFGLFNADPQVLDLAVLFVPCGILTFFGFALRSPFFGVVNGIGFASFSLFIGLMDGVVARIGLSLLLGKTFGLGIVGYWYGNALAGFVPFILAGAYFLSGRWKHRRLITQ